MGLALFLSFIALAMRCAIKAVSIFRRRGERSMELMGRAIVVALAGILAADFFLSEQYSKQLWLLLAMGPALLSLARRGSAVGDDRRGGRDRRTRATAIRPGHLRPV